MTDSSAEFAPWRGVFETLRVIDGVPLFVPEHEAELRRAAAQQGLPVDLDPAHSRQELPAQSGRWRWLVTPAGTRTLFSEEPDVSAEPIELSLSPVRLGSENWDARFKTVSYLSHVQALKIASTPEVILLNEFRDVASAARANLFWRRGDRLFTPAHEAGCRRGIVRAFLLQHHAVEEGHFPLDDLLGADEIFLTNSLRGLVSVRSVEGRPLESSSAAQTLRPAYAQAIANQLIRPL
jgi:branched-subunit amino acid aminotransferase/4-amino-4-deoxychorismate lyase